MKKKLKAIIDWESFCKAKGTDPKALPDVSTFPEEDREYTLNHWKLTKVIEFFKEGKKIDYLNRSQKKHYPWSWVIKDETHPAGFGLSHTDYYYDHSCTAVGSRLCSLDEETARHIFENFKDLYIINQLT